MQSFRRSDCDTDHYLAVVNVRERLSVRKRTAPKFNEERFNLKKLSEVEVREKCQIRISNRFAALENLHDSGDINRAWENTRENINISDKESLGLFGSNINIFHCISTVHYVLIK
jgi:hypothetical protein